MGKFTVFLAGVALVTVSYFDYIRQLENKVALKVHFVNAAGLLMMIELCLNQTRRLFKLPTLLFLQLRKTINSLAVAIIGNQLQQTTQGYLAVFWKWWPTFIWRSWLLHSSPVLDIIFGFLQSLIKRWKTYSTWSHKHTHHLFQFTRFLNFLQAIKQCCDLN